MVFGRQVFYFAPSALPKKILILTWGVGAENNGVLTPNWVATWLSARVARLLPQAVRYRRWIAFSGRAD
jgi:hypothetical protein